MLSFSVRILPMTIVIAANQNPECCTKSAAVTASVSRESTVSGLLYGTYNRASWWAACRIWYSQAKATRRKKKAAYPQEHKFIRIWKQWLINYSPALHKPNLILRFEHRYVPTIKRYPRVRLTWRLHAQCHSVYPFF